MANVRFKVADDVVGLAEFESLGNSVALCAKAALARQLERARGVLESGGEGPPVAALSDLRGAAGGGDGSSAVVWLNDVQDQALKAVASKASISKEDAAAALVRLEFSDQLGVLSAQRRATALREAKELSTLSQVLVDSGKREAGEHQQAFFDHLQQLGSGPADNRVLFAEAGTGVGKTFAMLVAAAEFSIRNPGKVVVLAFPTYAVLEQAHTSWRQLKTEALGASRPLDRVVLSQSAFVSQTALAEWLESVQDEPLKDMINAWVAGGAVAPPGSRSEAAWQMVSLQQACGGSFPEAFEADINVSRRLDSHGDEGYLSYLRQRGLYESPHFFRDEKILFMTHAMLATFIVGSRNNARQMLAAGSDEDRATMKTAYAQWKAASPDERGLLRQHLNDRLAAAFESLDKDLNEGFLEFEGIDADVDEKPLIYADLLIVDECHLFEEWVSRILGADISVWGLLQDVKALRREYPRSISADAVHALEREFELLKARGRDEDLDGDGRGGMLAGLWAALDNINARGANGKMAKSREWRRIDGVKRVAAVLKTQRVGASSTVARLTWSPDRAWPRIQVGRTSVASELDWLWSHMSARSALVSATMYETVPQLNVETARRTLGVRSNSVITMSPLHPSWIFDPVTVMLARLLSRPDQTLRFVRPKSSLPPTEAEINERGRWAAEVADYISGAWDSAAGGMLVLMTSYADMKLVEARLAQVSPAMPLVVQQRGRHLERVRQDFLAQRARGGKPVLLLVGAGWTGFDVSVPGDANGVTDLVIPVMPFGTNRSITQAARELNQGVMPTTYAATMMARQGMGRLVREENTLPNRRIHFLDARWEAPATRGMFVPIVRWIHSKYTRVVSV